LLYAQSSKENNVAWFFDETQARRRKRFRSSLWIDRVMPEKRRRTNLLHHRWPSVMKKRMLRRMVARFWKSFIKNVAWGMDKGSAREKRRFRKMDATEKARWLRRRATTRATTVIAIHQSYCIIIYNYCVTYPQQFDKTREKADK